MSTCEIARGKALGDEAEGPPSKGLFARPETQSPRERP